MAIMRDVPILSVVSASVQQSKILNKLCNGEEVRFVLNGAENLHKVQTYTLANQPPDLRYKVNDCRKKAYCLGRIMWKR